jgi:hypothetical protein
VDWPGRLRLLLRLPGRESLSSSWSFIWRGGWRKRLVTNQPTATGIAAIKRAWKAERTTSRASAGYGGGHRQKMRERITDEENEGTADGRPIQNSNSGYPTANTQQISPRPSAPSGSTDVIPCNFKSPTASTQKNPTLHPARPCSRGTRAISDCRSAQKMPPAARKVRQHRCT